MASSLPSPSSAALGAPDRPPRPARPQGVFGGSAWYLGRVGGIDLAIDHSWVLIFLLVTFSLASHFGAQHPAWGAGERWGAALFASLLFFASILLHELGHSFVALRLGIRVRSITLFIFGGVAQLASEPRRPRDEVLVAVAGPLVSVALGFGFLWLGARVPAAGDPWAQLSAASGWLGRINLLLAVFNAVPGFPLDGGRVLRGALWLATGSFERATRLAGLSGSLFAIGLMIFGGLVALGTGQLLGGLWLVLIGWFLLAAARTTVGQVVIERVLQRVRAGETMEPVADSCLSGAESVAELAGGSVLRRGLRTFYVVDATGRLLGLATLRELAATPPAERERTPVREVMIPADRLAVLRPEENGWVALRRMAEYNVNQLPVVEGGVLRGAVTREKLLSLVQAAFALGIGEPEELARPGRVPRPMTP